jgi:hypothetical protein
MILASCSGAGETQVCAVRETCVRHHLHRSGTEREMQARPLGPWGCRYFLAVGDTEDGRWLAAE